MAPDRRHFHFNAWDEKFAPYDRDLLAGELLAERYGDDVVHAPLAVEGSAITVEGESRRGHAADDRAMSAESEP